MTCLYSDGDTVRAISTLVVCCSFAVLVEDNVVFVVAEFSLYMMAMKAHMAAAAPTISVLLRLTIFCCCLCV